MSSRLLILAIGMGFSSLSFAQSPADIRAELTSLNRTLHTVSNLTTASKGTKDTILSQLMKIQSEVSNIDLPNGNCPGDVSITSSCAGMKQDLHKRISTAIASAKHVDRYSSILIEEALTGADTDLVGITSSQNGISLGSLEEEQPKPRKKHIKLDCTPSPPNAVICNGEFFKKDNSALSDDTIKAVSEKAFSAVSMGMEQEDIGTAKTNEAL